MSTQSVPVRSTVLTVLIWLLAAFLITGLLSNVLLATGQINFKWDAANSIATFAAVLVALGFGMREASQARRNREWREMCAIAKAAAPLAMCLMKVAAAQKSVLSAMKAGSTDDDLMDAVELSDNTFIEAQTLLRTLDSLLQDLPTDVAVSVALTEGLAGAFAADAGWTRPVQALKNPETREETLTAIRDILERYFGTLHEMKMNLRLAQSIMNPRLANFHQRTTGAKVSLYDAEEMEAIKGAQQLQ